MYDYKALPLPGAVEYMDESAGGASYSLDSKKGEMISYDTVTAASRKIGYIMEMALGGGMWWEASGDRPAGGAGGQGSLIAEVSGALARNGLDSSLNTLVYPESKYDNLRAGFPGE